MSQNLPADDFKWVRIKLRTNLLDKKKNVIHMKSLKQALIHRLVFENFIESLNFMKKRKQKMTLKRFFQVDK